RAPGGHERRAERRPARKPAEDLARRPDRARARHPARHGDRVAAKGGRLRPRGVAPAGRGRDGRARPQVSEAPPVATRGLVKRYGEIVAVAHVDLTGEPGDVFGYLGPDGAGKPTSLRMMLGLIPSCDGTAPLLPRDSLRDT